MIGQVSDTIFNSTHFNQATNPPIYYSIHFDMFKFNSICSFGTNILYYHTVTLNINTFFISSYLCLSFISPLITLIRRIFFFLVMILEVIFSSSWSFQHLELFCSDYKLFINCWHWQFKCMVFPLSFMIISMFYIR